MASRHDIINITFQANAAKANVALQALQAESKKSSDKVKELRKQLEEGLRANLPVDQISKIRGEIKAAEKDVRQWNSAYRDLTKGVRTLDEAIKQFNAGTMNKMSAAFNKAAVNAAKLAQTKMTPGTKEWKEMDALIVEAQSNVLKATTNINGLVSAIKKGGEASKSTLTQAKADLEQLLTLEVRGNAEWNTYNKQLKVVQGELNKLAEAERKVAQADQTAMMTKRMKSLKTLSSDALTETKRYWETMVAGAEKGSAEMAKYEANLKKVVLQERQRKAASAEQVLGNMGGYGIEQVRQATQDMEKLRDSVVKGTPAWNHWNKLVNEGNAYLTKFDEEAKIARGDAMSLGDALKISSTAGGKGFQGTATQLQQAEAALQKAAAAAKKGTPDWYKYQEALAKVRVEMNSAGMTSERMREIISKPTNAKNLNELQAAVKRAKAELDLMAGTVGKNSTAYTQLAEQTKKAEIQLKSMQAQSHGTASAFEKAWSRLKTYVGLYVGAAVAMQKIVAAMGDLMELSDKMGEVRKTTGFTADEVGRLSTALAKMDTRTTLTGLMELSAVAGQLGLKTEQDVRGFTEAANMLMVALPEMGKEGATAMLKVALATGEIDKIRQQMQQGLVEGSDAVSVAMTKIGSTIDSLRANSAAAAPAITDFVKRVGAVGAQSGITIDQVAALGSTVDALGMRIEMAATALSRMIPAIKNNAFEIAKAIGVTPETIRGLFDAGRGMEAILMILQHIKDSGADSEGIEQMLGMGGMADIMKDLNQQGARAGIVFAGLSQNVDELRRQLGVAKTAYEENIAIQNEYNKMNETTAAKWERLKNDIEEMFVTDSAQRWLGGIIDGMRSIAAFIGSDGPLSIGFKMMIAYLVALKIGLGELFVTLLPKYLSTAVAGFSTFITNVGTYATGAFASLRAHIVKTDIATKRAAISWKEMNATMSANAIMAVVAALGYLAYKLWDAHKAALAAAEEIGQFNEKLSQEKKALDDLFTPLNRSNLAQMERSRLISEINSKYSKYLGYMLSETNSAIQLAEAHALIAQRVREEAYEKRILEQEDKVRQSHEGGINAAYGKLSETIRGAATGKTNIQDVMDTITGYLKGNLYRVKEVNGARVVGDENYRKDIDGLVERLALEGKISRKELVNIKIAVGQYNRQIAEQYVDIQKATADTRSDLRNTQRDIAGSLSTNVNTLIDNLKNFGKEKTPERPGILTKPEPENKTPYAQQMQAMWMNNENPDWKNGGKESASPSAPLPTQLPKVDKNDIESVRKYVQYQDELRGLLEANAKNIDAETRAAAEAWLESKESMDEYRKLLAAKGTNSTGGSGEGNPWGTSLSAESTDYDKMTAEALVTRRKQMKDFVNSINDDTDIEAVLKEDAALQKAIAGGLSKNFKSVVEWYNKERLKIQDELHARHLTNTGDWMDPKKGGKKASKQVQDEMKYYLDELDAYYTERKAKIQEQRNDEQISEAEAWRRTLQNDAEWRQRRAELQELYAKKSEKVTQEEQDAIFDILSERTGDTVKYIQKDIEHTVKFIEKVGTEKGKPAMDRILGDLDEHIEQDFLRQRTAVGKQMEAIADIIEKERPFNGITKNLEDNLTKMGVLQADFEKQRLALIAKREDTSALDKKYRDEIPKRLTFMLTEAERAYNTNITSVMERMADAGMTAWADELRENPQMQEALMAQLRNTFDKIQEAVKKEASLWKKEAETMWNNIMLPNGQTLKQAADNAVAQLSLSEGRVTRANNLIGAGQASERVADKLAIQQMKIQLTLQEQYYALLRQRGEAAIKNLREQAQLARQRHDTEKATRLELDAQHAEMALNLATSKEELELAKQREQITARTEEIQNRLYKEIKSYVDILTTGLQKVFEASNTGNEEYYNERAKLNLTGESGGAQQYIIIDNAGTEDAEAHYETLSELEYLERKHEIEQENAQADAWKALMDGLAAKMDETITDQINAWFQDQATKANTEALRLNTEALQNSTEAITGNGNSASSSGIVPPVAPAISESTTIINNNNGGGKTPSVEIGTLIPEGIIPEGGGSEEGGAAGGGINAGGASLSMFPMTEEEVATAQANIELLWKTYTEQGASAMIALAEQLGGMQNIVLPPWQMPEGGVEGAVERIQQLWEAYAEYGIEAMQEMSDAMGEMENLPPDPTHLTEDGVNNAIENASTLAMGQAQAQMDASQQATETIKDNQKQQQKGAENTNAQTLKSSESMWAKMTKAMNLYGVAYQAMSNDNLSTEQKFEMIALQTAGNAAMAGLQVATSNMTAKTSANLTEGAAKSTAENGPILGPILFAVCSALIGGLMGLAMSKLSKAKSDISSVTGASSSASVGKLTTGMLTYAEGNVNEFTDPGSLTPGHSYNVDAADGRTYRARYMGANPRTHITNGPEFHLAGERGREMIIDAGTTKQIVFNEPAVMKAIETLSVGGRLRRLSSAPRRGRGVAAFADGNIEDFEEMANEQAAVANGTSINLEALQSSLDRQSDLLEDLRQNGIKAHFDVYGKGGLIDSYDTGKKFVSDRDWPY